MNPISFVTKNIKTTNLSIFSNVISITGDHLFIDGYIPEKLYS